MDAMLLCCILLVFCVAYSALMLNTLRKQLNRERERRVSAELYVKDIRTCLYNKLDFD